MAPLLPLLLCCHSPERTSSPERRAPAVLPETSPRSVPAAEDAAADAVNQLAPLSAAGPMVPLAVEGFREAVLAVPRGAREARPLMVALHGNFDRPEWQCEVWRDIVGERPFILCPRGVPRADAPKQWDRWTYTTAERTEAELEAAVAAARQHFTGYIADGPVLFTGFSLGAIYGVRIVTRHPERYTRAVMIEGGYKGWSLPIAKGYLESGGERVLFACGQAACKAAARNAARLLERGGIAAKVSYLGPAGHTYDGKVADSVAAELTWLLEGAGGWAVVPDASSGPR
jgi:poly(3-hydroxybutyrate) depolymerase